MKLYISEMYKIITKKMFWAGLLAAAALNALLCIWSSGNEYFDAGIYKKIYSDIAVQRLDNEGIREYLQAKLAECGMEDFKGQELYARLLMQLDRIETYDSFLEGIDTRAENIIDFSIFGKPDGFSYRSILRTPPAYRHLKGNKLSFCNSQAVIAATGREFTDVFALLLIFFTATTLVLNEKEKGLFSLVRTTKRGRIPLLGAKLAAVFTYCAFIYIILYIGNYLTSIYLYGNMDLSARIQSVEGFLGATVEVTVGGYFLIYSLTKLAAYILIASVLVLLCVIAHTGLMVYVITLSAASVSSLLYVLIPGNSYLSMLKYANMVSILHTNKIYKDYLDINFFDIPVNLFRMSLFILIAGILLFIVLNLYIFKRQKNVIFHESRLIKKIMDFLLKHRRVSSSLFSYESFKALIVNKALVILILAAVIGWYNYKTYRMPYIQDDAIYKYYVTQVKGEITEDTYKYLEKERLHYENLRKQLAEMQQALKEGKMNFIVYNNLSAQINSELKREVGLHKVMGRVKELEPYYKDDVKNKPWLLYDTGYNQLLGIMENKRLNATDLIFAALLIACISPIYAAENTSGASRLIKSTKKGRISSLLARTGIGSIITIMLFAVTYTPMLYNILDSYGTDAIDAPVQSLSGYHDVRFSISIGGFLCLIYAIKLFTALLMMALVICISHFSRNETTAISAAAGIFVLPYVLYIIGASYIEALLWIPNILGYTYFIKPDNTAAKWMLPGNTLLAAVFSFILIRKTISSINHAQK